MLEETIARIRQADRAAMEECEKNWDNIAKPLKSRGLLEKYVIQLAGIQGTARIFSRWISVWQWIRQE